MRIPKIKGVIKRRLLVNFRASPQIVQQLLPYPFRPKLQGGHSLVGICLIRLEDIRPVGIPGFLGISSENAAHRIAVEWSDSSGTLREGVYIPRRDSNSWLNHLAGGRIFPGVHHAAEFSIVDHPPCVKVVMRSTDGSVSLSVTGREADVLSGSSCFSSLGQASAFFEGGSLGYSAGRQADTSDGLVLSTKNWHVRPLEVSEIHSSYFEDISLFPSVTVTFDHALIMRDIDHEWHGAPDLHHARSPNRASRSQLATTQTSCVHV